MRLYDVSTAPDGSAFVVASRTLFADVYVMKVTSSGSTAYLTDIPGLTMSAPYPERPAIAAGTLGNVAVAGRSVSGSFGVPPTTVGPAGGEDAVVVMLDPRGAITSATVIGGTGADAGADVAMDAAGSIYVAGRTSSENFPVTPLAARSPSAACAYPGTATCDNAFVVKLDALGGPVFAAYYGGSSADRAVAVGVDRTGGVYVTGLTVSRDFPVVRAVQSTIPWCSVEPNVSCPAVGFVVR